MSKSILVIDTPEKCYVCPCGSMIENKFGYADCECEAEEREIAEKEFMSGKPDWCPLKSLPQKMVEENRWFSEDYAKGRNDCIDEILKGADGNE